VDSLPHGCVHAARWQAEAGGTAVPRGPTSRPCGCVTCSTSTACLLQLLRTSPPYEDRAPGPVLWLFVHALPQVTLSAEHTATSAALCSQGCAQLCRHGMSVQVWVVCAMAHFRGAVSWWWRTGISLHRRLLGGRRCRLQTGQHLSECSMSALVACCAVLGLVGLAKQKAATGKTGGMCVHAGHSAHRLLCQSRNNKCQLSSRHSCWSVAQSWPVHTSQADTGGPLLVPPASRLSSLCLQHAWSTESPANPICLQLTRPRAALSSPHTGARCVDVV
jgi:hypothetical protein